MKKRLLTFLIILPFLGFSQEPCPYLTSYKAQKDKYKITGIGEEGHKIIQIDSLSYFTFFGLHYFFLDSNKCEPYTGKVINSFVNNRYDSLTIVNGREIGLSKFYYKHDNLVSFKYYFDTIKLYRSSSGFSSLTYFDTKTKKYSNITLNGKKGRIKMKILYDMGGERKKEKIILKNRQELENYFLENKYYKFLKSLYFFDEFPTEVYDLAIQN